MEKKQLKNNNENFFLECERWWIFMLMMSAGGYYGAYTYTCKGGVFCNAQTANCVLFAMAIGGGNFKKAAYYLVPMAAYLAGTILSEILPNKVKQMSHIRWDTVFVGIEILIVLVLGFLPDKVPVQVFQVTVNFMASMQYNTFRRAENIPMATTFCTNHVRQTGVFLVKWLKHRDDKSHLKRSAFHAGMIGVFIVGGIISTIFCTKFGGKGIWGAEILLVIAFADLLHADLTKEKNLIDKVPSGH